jgi:hypothetical protein
MPSDTQARLTGPAMPTRHEPTFRSWPPERLTGPAGQPVLVTLCEELDAESGRWEPFVTIRPIRTTEDVS